MKKTLVACVIGAFFGILLLGCSGEQITSFRAVLEQKEQAIAGMRAQVNQLKLLAANSDNVQLTAAAENADKALKFAEEQMPAMRKQLADLEGAQPGWKVALSAAWPLIIWGLKFIPGPGAAIAAPIANGLWSMTATKQQKLADAGTAS